jgi:hypothetical protein
MLTYYVRHRQVFDAFVQILARNPTAFEIVEICFVLVKIVSNNNDDNETNSRTYLFVHCSARFTFNRLNCCSIRRTPSILPELRRE